MDPERRMVKDIRTIAEALVTAIIADNNDVWLDMERKIGGICFRNLISIHRATQIARLRFPRRTRQENAVDLVYTGLYNEIRAIMNGTSTLEKYKDELKGV